MGSREQPGGRGKKIEKTRAQEIRRRLLAGQPMAQVRVEMHVGWPTVLREKQAMIADGLALPVHRGGPGPHRPDHPKIAAAKQIGELLVSAGGRTFAEILEVLKQQAGVKLAVNYPPPRRRRRKAPGRKEGNRRG